MNNSKSYYDQIARNYGEQATARINYLDAIDHLIITDVNGKNIENYLDIGAGDGRRSIKISNNISVNNVTLLDESSEMLNKLQDSKFDIVNESFLDFNSTKKYDLITCLWNVIGHLPDKKSRILFFDKISNLLSDNGAFYFDVNNRYNISNYGYKNVMITLDKDNYNAANRGWFTIGAEETKTNVYIH
ncbi:MAG: class I SAM-dependent methyltransferase [Algicola sp.]|nr:class I SAM-dependent methyltransferase [Algicola sp.]